MKNVIECLSKEKTDPKVCFDFVRKQFKLFAQYKEHCEKSGYGKTTEAFAVVPAAEQEFSLLANPHVVKMLLAMELTQPTSGEW